MKTLTKTTLILSSALALAACGGGGGHESGTSVGAAGSSGSQSLVYSYPDNGQTEVAAPSPVVLRFTSEVSSANGITLHEGDASGPLVATKPAEFAPDHKGVILTPQDPLKAHQSYTVVVHNVGTISNKTISFETRALQEGPKSLVVEDSDFKVKRRFPDGTTNEPVMDFSTFRLQFSQPIDPSTAHYGADPTDSIKLTDQNGDLVDATLIVDGPYMTIDPKKDYLNPGQHYTLTLGTGLASTYGETLAQADDIKFTPKDSTPNGGPPAMLVQHITDSQNGNVLSPLSGAPVNEVAVKGTLLGEVKGANSTQASAVVRAELADLTTYTNVLPIRIPKGTVLTGSSIDIKIGGKVDAGYDSGDVTMTLLSDATGTMVLNPYSTQADAPRIVHLFMDVGITTADPRANGGFTQNILHIELVGTSKVDTKAGVLDLDAISVVQPDVLGQEYGYAVLSFQLKSDRDQATAPAPTMADSTPPKVQSWTFGTDDATGLDKTAMFQPTDPRIINFDKPLDPQSIIGHVHLYKEEGGVQTELDAKVHVDGAAIVIKPKDPLEHPEETGSSLAYKVSLASGITDITGNQWVGNFDQTFQPALLVEKRDIYKHYVIPFGANQGPAEELVEEDADVPAKSPYILGVYPGYPCPLNPTTRDLANGLEGRCNGGMQPNTASDSRPGEDSLGSLAPLPADDLLPVSDMPANRPIIVVFSKPIDRNSLFDDQGNTPTFQVYKVDAANPDNHGATVSGTVTLAGDTLRFVPNQPWEDGQLYAYELKSNGDATTTVTYASECNAKNTGAFLCGQHGYPLNTQMMGIVSTHDQTRLFPTDHPPVLDNHFIWQETSSSHTGGGPDFVQYFVGVPPTANVLQLLRMPQYADQNDNLFNDSNANHTLADTVRLGGVSAAIIRYSKYDYDETADIDWQSDPSTANLTDPYFGKQLDPEGVEPPPNSAKILSSSYGFSKISQISFLDNPDWAALFAATGALGNGGAATAAGANIGCGWTEVHEFTDQTSCDVYGFSFFGPKPPCYYAVPAVCPMNKFTYLHGVLFADVTDDTANGALQVRIYPGRMVTSSFRVYTKGFINSTGEVADTGYQIMRMRYPVGQKYIEGQIMPGPDGRPALTTAVDLYMDAPDLVHQIVDVSRFTQELTHNLYSYPVSMSLSGGIRFLSDGRMVVEQHNENALEIHQRANAPYMMIDLLVPAQGTNLRYVSQPIK